MIIHKKPTFSLLCRYTKEYFNKMTNIVQELVFLSRSIVNAQESDSDIRSVLVVPSSNIFVQETNSELVLTPSIVVNVKVYSTDVQSVFELSPSNTFSTQETNKDIQSELVLSTSYGADIIDIEKYALNAYGE